MVDMIDLHGLITSYLPRRLLYQRDLDHSDLTIVLQLQIAAPAGYRAGLNERGVTLRHLLGR